MATAHFADRLAAAIDARGNFGCVGLDPVLERLPADVRGSTDDPAKAISVFSLGVLQAVAGVVPAVKFQSACYERYGTAGLAALHDAMTVARQLDLVVILDAKRGDIGVSAEHYAAAAFGAPALADALTVNGYLGPDTLEPYLTGPDRGLFVLVRTSNPGSDVFQSAPLASGGTVSELMATLVCGCGRKWVGERGLSNVGAVVGATKAADASNLRRIMPQQVFLVPGYGAQGGAADDVRGMMRPGARTPGEAGVLVTASRSVLYPKGADGAGWTREIRAAATVLAAELAQIGV